MKSRRSGGLKFTLFSPVEPFQPWLVVEYGNREYDWMFRDVFRPLGGTHYLAVDLKALADSTGVESTKPKA